MLGNGVEMSSIFGRVLGPLVLGWAPNHFVLGAQFAHGEKGLVCIPEYITWKLQPVIPHSIYELSILYFITMHGRGTSRFL